MKVGNGYKRRKLIGLRTMRVSTAQGKNAKQKLCVKKWADLQPDSVLHGFGLTYFFRSPKDPICTHIF